MKEPSLNTIKRLFALSRNLCAFPECGTPIVAGSGSVLGNICHIRARSRGGPRYDSKQSNEERNAFSNLILLCGTHHDIIDNEPELYTVDVLVEMKSQQEKNGRNEVSPKDTIFARILLNDYERRIQIVSNSGNIMIDSPGAVQANTINIRTQKKTVQVLPPQGTVANDLQMRGYIKHLIDRYNEFSKSDPTRAVKFSYGAVYKNIEHNFGVNWQFVPVDRFEDLVRYLQGRIDRTRQAKINKGKAYRNYRSFHEFCAKHMKTDA
jgi:hypothetical protein